MHHETIIIGAGLSGLACAHKLHQHNRNFLLLDSSDAPGGRVRTDAQEGYLLDRGFQVYLDAYPTAGQLLDLPALKLKHFEPGALVYQDGKLHRVMDVFRRPQHLLSSALAPIGTLADKLRVALLRFRLLKTSIEDIQNHPEQTTEDYLRAHSFSEGMINGFFRSFYGGIFLENELRTSSRMFEFTFQMFARGSATLPAKGMQEIPKQLAAQLPSHSLRLNTAVKELKENTVTLDNGETLSADHIILATPAHVTADLLPQITFPHIPWRSVTNLYFTANHSPLSEPIIALNGSGTGLVNNVCVLSDVSADYAPPGKSLISVSVLGLPERSGLAESIQYELESWFGEEVRSWELLRIDRIPHALPEQPPTQRDLPSIPAPYHLCGDYRTTASIEGAVLSGQRTAEKILKAS